MILCVIFLKINRQILFFRRVIYIKHWGQIPCTKGRGICPQHWIGILLPLEGVDFFATAQKDQGIVGSRSQMIF